MCVSVCVWLHVCERKCVCVRERESERPGGGLWGEWKLPVLGAESAL